MHKSIILLLTSMLITPTYANYEGFFKYSATACGKNNLMQFDEVQRCSIGSLVWAKKDGKYGFVGNTGDVIVPLVYEKASEFFGDVGFVKQGLTWVAFDKDGNQLYTLIANDVVNDLNDNAKIIRNTEQGKQVGLIEKSTGKILIPAKYDDLDNISEGMVGFMQNNQYGFLDLNGKVIVKPIYDGVGSFRQGKAVVYKEGKSGVINKKGKLIAPFTPQQISILHDGSIKYWD